VSGIADVDLRLVAAACLAIVVVWLTMRWGLFPQRNPEKRARWKALPLRFKFACWFGVTPLYVLSVALVLSGNKLMALAALLVCGVAWFCTALLEVRVVAWYRENGLFRTYEHEPE